MPERTKLERVKSATIKLSDALYELEVIGVVDWADKPIVESMLAARAFSGMIAQKLREMETQG